MTDAEHPQIYLVTPPAFEIVPFIDRLAAVLDAHPVACLRVAMASGDEYTVYKCCRSNKNRRRQKLKMQTRAVHSHTMKQSHYWTASHLNLQPLTTDSQAIWLFRALNRFHNKL